MHLFFHACHPEACILLFMLVILKRVCYLTRCHEGSRYVNSCSKRKAYGFGSRSFIAKAECALQDDNTFKMITNFFCCHIFLLYCPPTENKAFVICPNEHTFTASINTANTLPFSRAVFFNSSNMFSELFLFLS